MSHEECRDRLVTCPEHCTEHTQAGALISSATLWFADSNPRVCRRRPLQLLDVSAMISNLGKVEEISQSGKLDSRDEKRFAQSSPRLLGTVVHRPGPRLPVGALAWSGGAEVTQSVCGAVVSKSRPPHEDDLREVLLAALSQHVCPRDAQGEERLRPGRGPAAPGSVIWWQRSQRRTDDGNRGQGD